jgi:hypothetical protein
MKYEKGSLEHIWKCLYDIQREQNFLIKEMQKIYKEMNVVYESLREIQNLVRGKNDQRMDKEPGSRCIARDLKKRENSNIL